MDEPVFNISQLQNLLKDPEEKDDSSDDDLDVSTQKITPGTIAQKNKKPPVAENPSKPIERKIFVLSP